MKSKTKITMLSKSNIWYFGIVAGLFVLPYFVALNWDAGSIGYLIGTILFLFLIPFLIAGAVWLISGSKGKSAAITFNIILTLILFSKLSAFLNTINQ